ncbi:ATP-binding SpoIIE family protein phosphatase [Streptomyces sp. TRM68416]|uniref:ATP-binding SpoIIE family protein phosphatase n=1 Tax=Streptomyces sp. TRM68416 TaxID=2758412 RepID=UPI00166218E0|nr:ATP-binding SpoIIE family protein phosphatase [Streptomyces sp. TRM68416]MBD0844708.1 SpoIIE family protein phosphatase [Streptomyces sp. TRM68416]
MARVWDVPVHDPTRVRDARVAAEAASALAGLGERRTAAAALVASELATNLLKHAGGGQLLVDVVAPPLPRSPRPGAGVVQIAAIDRGPGLDDVPGALSDGFSTAASLGAGLGTCRRAADTFDLHGAPGRGTVAVARIGDLAGPGTPAGASARAGGITVPFAGADCSGDAWTWARSHTRLSLVLADGLGRGPEAAAASGVAVQAVHRSAHLAPAELLRQAEDALRGTRGAAMAVAQLDTGTGVLSFAGVGNVGARLRHRGTWRPLLSRPGAVGVHRPARLHQQQVPWAPDGLLILHSDGLPSRWTPPPDAFPRTADPAVAAAVTVRDASSFARPVRDDLTVAVLSPAADVS